MPRVTVVIPTRSEPTLRWCISNITMWSLKKQSFQSLSLVPVWDRNLNGAGWARNQGFKAVETELVLFSDDDVNWKRDGLQLLVDCLDAHPEAAYSYGAYRTNWIKPGQLYTVGNQAFSGELLKERNFISTMSLIRAKDFPGFDESLRRYQDWDLWLTMLEQGKTGVYCGKVIFETRLAADGVTFGSIPMQEARGVIQRKHSLAL